MIRSLALLSCATLALSLTACGSTGDGSGGSAGSGGSTCSTDSGACAAPFTAPPAGEPSADCKDNRELTGIPDGTVLKKACSPYHVKNVATAQGLVTIEAGVHIQLATGASFQAVDNEPNTPRHIEAIGTACDPIVFEPDSADARFGHVQLGSTAAEKGVSHLSYVEFRRGSSGNAGLDAPLIVGGVAPVLLDHVNIIDSLHYGLGITNQQVLDPKSNSIYVEGAQLGAAYVEQAISLGGLPTLLAGCTQKMTPEKGILVQNGGVSTSMTWASQPVDLLFPSTDLGVHPSALPTVLTISAPNTLLFGTTVNLNVGGNGGVPANLVADGDITFDAIDPIGGWKGFYINGSANQDTVLRGGHIGHAGTVEGFGTKDGKTAFASVIVSLSQVNPEAWPKIEKEDMHDANVAPAGAKNESACMFIGGAGAPSAPDYTDAMHANTFENCGPVNVAH